MSTVTNRHLDILRLVAQGQSNGQIARTLFVSEDTVKTHLRRAFLSLGVTTRTEAVMEAMRRGLLEDPDRQPYTGPDRRRGPGRRAIDARRTHPGPCRP